VLLRCHGQPFSACGIDDCTPSDYPTSRAPAGDLDLLRSNAPSNIFVPAEAIQKAEPSFPPEARKTTVSGTVSVLVVIDSSGSVISAKALDGPYIFRRVSEEAARKWKFRPATSDGRSVESQQTIAFKFER